MSPILDSIGSVKGYGWGALSLASSAYEFIATMVATTSNVTQLTFSSIPSTYKHLEIRYFAHSNNSTNTNASAELIFNGDTSSNYTRNVDNAYILPSGGGYREGSAAVTSTVAIYPTLGGIYASDQTNAWNPGVIYILDYSNTTKGKSCSIIAGVHYNYLHSNDSLDAAIIRLDYGFWKNTTSAINRIDIKTSGYNFTTNSRFSLYGVKS